MSAWAVAVCGVLYLVTAVDLARKNDWPLALTFAAYAVANIGLILAMKR